MSLSPQSDVSCVNADRLFFGTDKGLIDEFTDFEAVCKKSDLLALAAFLCAPEKSTETSKEWTSFGETIPQGQRHCALLNFALSVLKKYGICEEAYDAYMKRVAQCAEPKPEEEIDRIWRDACNYYQNKISTNPDYLPPEEYAMSESLEPEDYLSVQ